MIQNYLFFVSQDIEMGRSKNHCCFSVNLNFILSMEAAVCLSVSSYVRSSATKFSQDWIIRFFLILYIKIADDDNLVIDKARFEKKI